MSRVTLGKLGRSLLAEKQVCIVLAMEARVGPWILRLILCLVVWCLVVWFDSGYITRVTRSTIASSVQPV